MVQEIKEKDLQKMSSCFKCSEAYYDIQCPNCGHVYEDYHYAPGCNFIFFCYKCAFKTDRLSGESFVREGINYE